MRDLRERIALGIFDKGPQTLTDFIRGESKIGNQIPVLNALGEMENQGLVFRQEPISNWTKTPGNARPYQLTNRGIKLAEKTLAKMTKKLVVGPHGLIDPLIRVVKHRPPLVHDFSVPFTAKADGKIIRGEWRFRSRRGPSDAKLRDTTGAKGAGKRDLTKLQKYVNENSFPFIADPDISPETLVQIFTRKPSKAGPSTNRYPRNKMVAKTPFREGRKQEVGEAQEQVRQTKTTKPVERVHWSPLVRDHKAARRTVKAAKVQATRESLVLKQRDEQLSALTALLLEPNITPEFKEQIRNELRGQRSYRKHGIVREPMVVNSQTT